MENIVSSKRTSTPKQRRFTREFKDEAVRLVETGGQPVEIWFADEARIGQKNKITSRWAKCGTRPSAPRDLRTASAYIFGAICQAEEGAGLVLRRSLERF